MINEFDYIFLKYIKRHYDNKILDKLIKDYEKGLSLVKRRQIKKYINSIEKVVNYKELLFVYILFKRTRENSYVDELQKELYSDIGDTSKKEMSGWYFELKGLLDELNLPPLQPTRQVVENINFYLE